MEFKKILVTPALAKDYLQANIMNRQLRGNIVLDYATQMQKGLWKSDTGECIKISKEGVILDGQHRLNAVIKANIPVYFHVAIGLDESVFDVIDTGKLRSSSDIFTISKVKYASATAAIISQYYLIKKQVYYKDAAKHMKLSNAELLQKYNEKPQYWADVAAKAELFNINFARILGSAKLGAIFAILKEINEDKALSFMQEFTTGREVTNDVILILRDKLIADKVSPSSKLNATAKMVYVIKTWNAYISGKTFKALRYSPDVEDLPTFLSK